MYSLTFEKYRSVNNIDFLLNQNWSSWPSYLQCIHYRIKKEICDIFTSMQNCVIAHFSFPALCSEIGPLVKVVQEMTFLRVLLCTSHSAKALIIISLNCKLKRLVWCRHQLFQRFTQSYQITVSIQYWIGSHFKQYGLYQINIFKYSNVFLRW